METNHPIQAITSINEQLCTTCIKYHESMKESISQLDQKMNLILRRFDEIISATTAKEQPLLEQNGINANGCSESERSSSVLSPHDATRSATEEEEDFVDLKANNSNINNGNGARKRKQPQNGGAPKLPKQNFNDHENSNFFNNSMPVLTEENSPMTNQQLLDTLTLATALGGTDANNEVLNAFFQSGILDDPNAFMNVLNASLQDCGGSGFTPDSDTKKKPARKSPKQQAAASPAGSLPFLSSNVKTEDFSEEQLREALAISVEASTQQCSNCYTTKTSAWRRAQDGNLICNACGLYFRMHQTNRPIYLRKNHIQTRYRKKNAAGINGESSAATSMMVMDDENNSDLNNSIANSSFFNSGFEALLATPTMAK